MKGTIEVEDLALCRPQWLNFRAHLDIYKEIVKETLWGSFQPGILKIGEEKQSKEATLQLKMAT